MSQVIVVTGSREWIYESVVRELLEEQKKHHGTNVTLIHGDCRGLDRIAGSVAEQLGFTVIAVPADWSKYGKGAGPVRNKEMLGYKPDLVLGFHENLAESKGTLNCLTQAVKAGYPISVYDDHGNYIDGIELENDELKVKEK